jgi:hypothetical protein
MNTGMGARRLQYARDVMLGEITKKNPIPPSDCKAASSFTMQIYPVQPFLNRLNYSGITFLGFANGFLSTRSS